MAWSGRLSTFSTKKKMFTPLLCDLSSDAPATTSLPERLGECAGLQKLDLRDCPGLVTQPALRAQASPYFHPGKIWEISSDVLHNLIQYFAAVSYTHLTLPTKA